MTEDSRLREIRKDDRRRRRLLRGDELLLAMVSADVSLWDVSATFSTTKSLVLRHLCSVRN